MPKNTDVTDYFDELLRPGDIIVYQSGIEKTNLRIGIILEFQPDGGITVAGCGKDEYGDFRKATRSTFEGWGKSLIKIEPPQEIMDRINAYLNKNLSRIQKTEESKEEPLRTRLRVIESLKAREVVYTTKALTLLKT